MISPLFGFPSRTSTPPPFRCIMETNNLQAQTGTGNRQDNSSGKTENSHNTAITVHGTGGVPVIHVR